MNRGYEKKRARGGGWMSDAENDEILKRIESEVVRMGGGAKRGVIAKRELEDAQEIRVSIRPPTFLGSIEMFTLRNLEPGDYHLMLVAIPRKRDSGLPK
jgi:hypothetical protein